MYTPVYGNSALHRHSKDTLLPLRQGKGIHYRSQVRSLKPRLKSWLLSRLRAYSLTTLTQIKTGVRVSESARWWLAPRLTFEYNKQTGICLRNTRNNCHKNKIYVLTSLLKQTYLQPALCARIYYAVSFLWPSRISHPGATNNSDVSIVYSRWRHNRCHWLWVKARHTDQATTRYETLFTT